MAKSVSSLSLTRRDFVESAKSGAVSPLYVEIPYASPAALYQSFSGPMSFLFESVKGPYKIARYSFIGFEPYAVYKIKNRTAELMMGSNRVVPDSGPLATLRNLLGAYRQKPAPGLPPFQGGWAGMLGYDFVHYLERLPATTDDDLLVPDVHFMMVDRLVAFDHMAKKAWIIFCPGARRFAPDDWHLCYGEAEYEISRMLELIRTTTGTPPPNLSETRLTVNHDVSKESYTGMVRMAKEYIAAGDIFQANLSLRVSAHIGKRSPWELYAMLRDINPSPFAAFVDFGHYQIVSSSPERLVMARDGEVHTRPIAGTRPRGRDSAEDSLMRSELLLNEKERAEHIMLIDLERNDLGRVCDYGSVEVDELMITEDYSHVMHIVSNIRGWLARGKTLADVIRGVFPGGTITGVPKVRCMEIIDELETLRRGPYTGSLGYLGFSGSMDLNIIIRTFVIKDRKAYVQAGAGIVADSDPEREYEESLKKAEALMKTLLSPGP
jgi:aminodeoxychorismate synthase component I